jgi:hypothetical protein
VGNRPRLKHALHRRGRVAGRLSAHGYPLRR